MPNPDNRRGVTMMLIAILLLSCMDAGLKQLSLHYPALQVTALRALASWPLIAAWALSRDARGLLRVRWRLHLLRGPLLVATITLFVLGVRQLPLTTAYTLFFIAPLLITALSAFVLRETVGRHRWVAIVVGFSGVLIALRPSGEGAFTWAGLAILAAACGYALLAITARVLGRTDTTQSMVFWNLSILAPAGALLAAPGWVAVAPGDWTLIAAIGVVGAVGQYAVTEAFARGEASVIAPLEYTALVWGVGFDLTIWKVLPDSITWLGAAIIVAAGIYLMRRERAERVMAEAPP